uniref:Uncharacterized protein n=1 Tax=Chenopodium quinoa TaxID=63459 RepID=A0A803N8Q6_CHEQI
MEETSLMQEVDHDLINMEAADEEDEEDYILSTQTTNEWNKFRDDLAKKMFQEYVAQRGQAKKKKHHSVINDIKTYTKFKWDDKKKMIVIPVEDLQEWHETPAESAYHKCIKNWDDICTLFAADRTIGDGAEQHEETVAEMENENENESTSETASGDSNKRLKRDRPADVVSSFAESFKEYMSKSTRPTSKDIYKEVSSVLGISRVLDTKF